MEEDAAALVAAEVIDDSEEVAGAGGMTKTLEEDGAAVAAVDVEEESVDEGLLRPRTLARYDFVSFAPCRMDRPAALRSLLILFSAL